MHLRLPPISVRQPFADLLTRTTDQPEHQRSARLLGALLVTILVLGIITLIVFGLPDANHAWRVEGTLSFLFIVIVSAPIYVLSQRFSYKLAALLLIIVLIAVITISSYPNIATWELNTLSYLVLPVLFSSAFLSLPTTSIIMGIVQLMPMVVASQIPDAAMFETLVAPFSFLMVVNALIIVVANHRNQLERARQQQIADSEHLLRMINDNIEETILFVDLNGEIQYASSSHKTLLGDADLELEGLSVYSDTFINRTHPDDRDILTQFMQAAAEPTPARLYTRLRHHDGHYLWLETNINALNDDNGNLLGVIIVSRDVGLRKQAEDALKASEAEARRLFAHNPLPMWVYDRETLAFLDVNDAAIQKYGYSREEFLAMTIQDIRPPEDMERLGKALQVRQTEAVHTGEWRHLLKDGRLIDVEITGHQIEYNGREASLIVAQDITARKRAEVDSLEREKLAVALAKERELGEIRNLFMRTVSHEFRTPLATILLAAEMLVAYADRITPARREESGATIRREIQRLENMLQDMMDILRIQDQHMALDAEPLNLEQFFGEMVDDFRRAAPDHPIRLEINVADTTVRGDARLLRYIVSNLLSNAIKYSPPERLIGMLVEQKNGNLHLKVRDQGIGIKPEDQKRLFEPFYRGSNVNEVSGTGLGLKIVHDCVHLYQGTITVESVVGVGTTFTVTLPML